MNKTKKHEILKVVLDMLADPDNKHLSISNVAKRVGIGKSTIYEYFDKKEDMIIGAIELMLKRNLDAILGVENFETMPFKEAFFAHFEKLLEIAGNNEMMQNYIHHPDISMLDSEKKLTLMKKMHETFDVIKKRLYEIMEKGIQSGLLKQNISLERTHTIEATIFGAVLAISDPLNNWESSKMIEDVYQSIILLHQ